MLNNGSRGQVNDMGTNLINVSNTKTYFFAGIFLIIISGVIYYGIVPAIKNQEWVKIIIFAALLLAVFYIIRMRFKTVPLSIVFAGKKVIIKTLFGVRDYQLSDITGLEYSEMGRMHPRHFLVFRNGDFYDIESGSTAEKITEYIQEGEN